MKLYLRTMSAERKVICDACGDVIETELIPAGEDNHDRIIDAYEHGCVDDGDEGSSQYAHA